MAAEDPTVLIVGGVRKGGRPRSTEPSTKLLSWVPVSEYDEIAKIALKHDTSVSAVARTLLRLGLRRFTE